MSVRPAIVQTPRAWFRFDFVESAHRHTGHLVEGHVFVEPQYDGRSGEHRSLIHNRTLPGECARSAVRYSTQPCGVFRGTEVGAKNSGTGCRGVRHLPWRLRSWSTLSRLAATAGTDTERSLWRVGLGEPGVWRFDVFGPLPAGLVACRADIAYVRRCSINERARSRLRRWPCGRSRSFPSPSQRPASSTPARQCRRSARLASGRSGRSWGELAECGVRPRTVDGCRPTVHQHRHADCLGSLLPSCAGACRTFGM